MSCISIKKNENDGEDCIIEKPPLVISGCDDTWTFNKKARSNEIYLSNNYKTAHFHPNWSKGTAGVRGTRILNNGRYFWEIKVSQRVFGTAMQWGVGTINARLHVNSFTNLLGMTIILRLISAYSVSFLFR